MGLAGGFGWRFFGVRAHERSSLIEYSRVPKMCLDRLCTVYDTFHLGRSEKCEIGLPDPFVSRFHAKVSWKDKVAIVFDLNSRNVTRGQRYSN